MVKLLRHKCDGVTSRIVKNLRRNCEGVNVLYVFGLVAKDLNANAL